MGSTRTWLRVYSFSLLSCVIYALHPVCTYLVGSLFSVAPTYRNHGILCHLKFVNAREYNNLDILACDKIDSNKLGCNISTERIEKMVTFRQINVATKLRILKVHRCKSAQDTANIQSARSNSNLSQIKCKFYLKFVSDFITASEILRVPFYRSIAVLSMYHFIDTVEAIGRRDRSRDTTQRK